ncbi:hypothetical protein GUA87_11675 [Sneathiella sp. P13V-1]|uniref:RHS repeat-associated core domain-containing protein n=1 Tax=Sneathiella sp. P13V-1 TaxID=2697366 RepID=UPI00187B5811|nr:RHS repeat-associated core domain-containing protein [Sneathiella sp. P13V-1]MBE7637506.1 hypothetical protein [Sneathiella sp. P13V-1]
MSVKSISKSKSLWLFLTCLLATSSLMSVEAREQKTVGVDALPESANLHINKLQETRKMDFGDSRNSHQGVLPKKAYFAKKPYELTVEEKTGRAAVTFPVAVAPGTNNMTPQLTLEPTGAMDNPIDIHGISRITDCGENALCLNGLRLIQSNNKSETNVFYLSNDPLTVVKKSNQGFHQINSKGYVSNYQKAASGNIWKITSARDLFGNFLNYGYDPQTGLIKSIKYGHKNEDGGEQRAVLFDFGTKEQPWTIVTSMIGERKVRSHVFSHGVAGLVNSYADCGYSWGDQPVCSTPIKFKWQSSKDENRNARLAHIDNGLDGISSITYDNRNEAGPVKSITEFDQGRAIRQVVFAYDAPAKKSDGSYSFGKVSRHEIGTKTFEITAYGSGDLSDYVLSKSRVFAKMLENGRVVPGNVLSKTEYKYEKLTSGPASSYVINEITEYEGNGAEKTVTRTKRVHDDRGRLIQSSNASGKIEYKYLDEARTKGSPDYASNLIVSEHYTNTREKSQFTKNWSYDFNSAQISSSSYHETRDGEIVKGSNRTSYLDDYGNVVRINDKTAVVRFEFDKELATYPSKISVENASKIDVAVFEHDTAHGQVLRQVLPNQTTTINTLDPFGRITKSVSSFETTGDGDERLQVIEAQEWKLTEDTRIQEIKSVSISGNAADNESATTSVKLDGFGNLLAKSNLSAGARGKLLESDVQYIYSVEGWQKQVTHPEKGVEVHHYDRAGRVISQEKEGYGITRYEYDEFARLAVVNTNGEAVRFNYDDKGRLITKSLSKGDVERYFYETPKSRRISTVKLPSGIIIDYTRDKLDRVTGKKVQIPVSKGKYYNFDTRFDFEGGRLSEVSYPDGAVLDYKYDEGSLTQIAWDKGKQVEDVVAKFDYRLNANGARTLSKKLGNGILERLIWNEKGHLSSIDLSRPISAVEMEQFSKIAYKIDEKSKLIAKTARTEKIGRGVTKAEILYSFNENEELVTALSLTGDVSVKRDYYNDQPIADLPVKQVLQRNGERVELDINPKGNVISRGRGHEKTSFTFDAENKLVQSTTIVGNTQGHTNYVYDHTGQRIAKINDNGSATYFINPFYEFRVFDDGRMQQTKHVWDQTGRILSVSSEITDKDLSAFIPLNGTKNAGGIAEYINAEITVVGGVSVGIFSAFLGLLAIAAVKGRTPIRPFLSVKPRFGNLVTVFVLTSFVASTLSPTVQAALSEKAHSPSLNETRYYHSDVRGSVYKVTDEGGLVRASYSYAPYGELEKTGISYDQSIPVFAGHEYDPETGLYYMGARYYDPVAGRFLTADPARSRANPYEYANSNPIMMIDPDGRAGDEAPLSRWQRFKNWTGIANWRCCGARNRQVIPDDWGGAPTEEEKAAFDEYHRAQSVQGWTRFGGYLQSLLVAPIVAYAFPSSKIVGGETIVPGYAVDVAVSAVKVTIFSAFGKAYTAVEALQWEQTMEEGATARDGYIMLAKRMVYKIAGQVPMFTAAVYFQRYISGFPMLDQDDFGSDLGYLLAQYTIMSIFGNLYLLPYYYGSKPWSATGDTDPAYRQLVADSTGVSGLLMKIGLSYRDFGNRREYWSEDRGGFFRSQYGWYAVYVTHMYALYHLGSVGYYSGYAIFGGIASATNMGFDWGQFSVKWIKNIVSLELSPASSPLALVNCRTRWSMTCIREVSPLTPETGCLVRCIGPTGGLRVAKYMDSSYASDYRIVEWLIETGRRPAPPSSDIESGGSDGGPRIVVIQEDDAPAPILAPAEASGDGAEMQERNEPFEPASDPEDERGSSNRAPDEVKK